MKESAKQYVERLLEEGKESAIAEREIKKSFWEVLKEEMDRR